MDKILDLKNRPKPQEPERYEAVLKKVEEKVVSLPPQRFQSATRIPEGSPRGRLEPSTSTKNPIPVMLTWSGPLYYHSPNARLLVGAMVILSVIGLFFIFVQRNIFATAFFLFSALMLLVLSRQGPPLVEFTVGPLSVRIGPREYKFSEIKSFWIEYNPGGVKELSLQVKKWYSPYIKIPLMEEDPVQVSAILLKFIPEVEHEDSILDSFSRLLGV